jgi:hypothetical protein
LQAFGLEDRLFQAAIGWVSAPSSSVLGQPQTLQLKQCKAGMIPAAGMVRTNFISPSHTEHGAVAGAGASTLFRRMGRPLGNLAYNSLARLLFPADWPVHRTL